MAVCLVTGGAGFIGSHLVEALLADGHTVRVLDNFSTGSLANLAEVAGRFELVRGSVTDLAAVRDATEGADYVFHFAAPPAGEQGLNDPVATHHCGATGTLHVLLAARKANVKRVLYASSCYVYGHANGLPRREDEPTLQPLSPYGVAKLTGEQHCVGFTGRHGLETVRLRYFNVFGPRQPAGSPYAAGLGLVVSQARAGRRPVLSGWLSEQQSLISVDDVVHATLLAAMAPRAAGRAYNIASARPTSCWELIATLNGLLGTRLHPLLTLPRQGEEVDNFADTRKAEVELGFCAGTDLETGLQRCLAHRLRRQGAARGTRAVMPAGSGRGGWHRER
jgi:UDP-glucose 4-epimerase